MLGRPLVPQVVRSLMLPAVAAFVLAQCGGSDGTGVTPPPPPPPPPPPAISSTTPAANATAVPVSTTVSATFSTAMNAATITGTSLLLEAVGGATVTGTVGYAAQVATFTPAAPLSGGTTYRATVTNAVQSQAGVALPSSYVWLFTTVTAPIGAIVFPLAVNARWLYEDTTRGTACSSTGCSNAYFGGRSVLVIDSQLTLAGENASRVRRYRLPRTGNFEVSTFYLAQRAGGLAKYNASAAAWRTVLSSSSSTFTNGAFLLAGGPVHAANHTLSTESVTVPAGTYGSAVSVRHSYTETGQFAPADIFENERESFADGVGLVFANQTYSYDDNDPQGLDQSSFTRFELRNAGTFTSPALLDEVEANDSGTTTLAALADSVIVSGDVAMGDAAAVVANTAAVSADSLGVRKVHDWYRLVAFRSGTLRIALVAERTNVDLDLYLLQMPATAWNQVAASTQPAGTAESIAIAVTAGQTYYVAVQAWNTAGGGRTNYWIFVR